MKNKKTYFSLQRISFVLLLVILISTVSALDYKPKKVNEQFSFCQICADASYITLSSIQTPNSTVFINTNMTSMGGGNFCYNYTPNQIGTYDFSGISNGCVKSWAVYVPVSSRGESYNGLQAGIIAAQGILIALFIGLGFSFSKEKWKLRGFFFILAMFMAVIMLNSIRILSGTSSSLDQMVTSGMLIGIIAVAFMAAYLLIIYTIEIFQNIKNKKEMKWQVSGKFN